MDFFNKINPSNFKKNKSIEDDLQNKDIKNDHSILLNSINPIIIDKSIKYKKILSILEEKKIHITSYINNKLIKYNNDENLINIIYDNFGCILYKITEELFKIYLNLKFFDNEKYEIIKLYLSKIVGMCIDKEIFEICEIIDIIFNMTYLTDRIIEAINIIINEMEIIENNKIILNNIINIITNNNKFIEYKIYKKILILLSFFKIKYTKLNYIELFIKKNLNLLLNNNKDDKEILYLINNLNKDEEFKLHKINLEKLISNLSHINNNI